MYWCSLLAWLAFCVASSKILCQTVEKSKCNDPLLGGITNSKANVIIGASLSFRTPGNGFGCNGIFERDTMETYDAYRWAIQILNQNSGHVFGVPVNDSFIPGIEFGLQVFEDCGRPELAYVNAIKLIPEIRSQQEYCTHGKNTMSIGMLGSTHRTVTGPLAAFLSEFKIPLISSQVVSAKARNVTLYPYFLRTAPNNGIQVQAIIELVKHLRWKQIAIIHTADVYGQDATKETIRLANAESVCIHTVVAMPITSEYPVTSTISLVPYQKVIEKITQKLPAAGIIVFSRSIPTLFHLLEAASLIPDSRQFRWIFSQSFGYDMKIIQKYNHILLGSFNVIPSSFLIKELQNFIRNINVNDPSGFQQNPWYGYQTMLTGKCRLPFSNFPQFRLFPICKHQSPIRDYRHHAPAIHAIYTFGNALRNAWLDKCHWKRGLCPKLQKLDRKEFFENYLKKTNFEYSETNRGDPILHKTRVSYDQNGDITSANFIISNYKRVDSFYNFYKVMTFDGRNLRSLDQITFYDRNGKVTDAILPSSCPASGCTSCVSL